MFKYAKFAFVNKNQTHIFAVSARFNSAKATQNGLGKLDKYQELKKMERKPLYLDAQATTPVDPRVLDAMLPYMTNMYGNPHSRTHAYGWESEKAVEAARGVKNKILILPFKIELSQYIQILFFEFS